MLTDTAFDSIHALLPAEASLSGPAARSNNPTPAPSSTGLPTPPPRNNNTTTTTTNTTSPHPAPPSYAQSTASPPALPNRNNPNPPPPPAAAPEKPVLTHARALYRYAASDARDCSFERDDRIAVYEYMNADWWMGKNLRSGMEGIFPRSYVVAVAADEKRGAPPALVHTPVQQGGWGQQHQQPAYGQQPQYGQPQYAGGGGYPMAPVPVQGYPAAPPPAQPQPQGQEQPPQEEESKMGKHGKNIGKKLGNAAIFGAGATIGSNIVNSIF